MTVLAYPNPNDVPVAVMNDCAKHGYAYAILEGMRLLHNRVGLWRKEGLTQEQYNTLPDYIRALVDYTPQLTQQQWRWFLNNWWMPRQMVIQRDIGELRAICKGHVIQYQSHINLEAIPI